MEQFDVTFVFDSTRISILVDAPSEEAAPDWAATDIYEDLGFSDLSSFLMRARDIVVDSVKLRDGS
jgi:hypothetical protein